MPPAAAPPVPSRSLSTTAATRLRSTMAATRVSFGWFGARKALTSEQKARAADGFDAEARYLSASKKLLDTQHPRFKAVTTLRGRIGQFWRSLTLPYPEPGIRLIRQEDIEVFDTRLSAFREELREVVADLQAHYAELRSAARERLGQLFSLTDYPESLESEFLVTWEFPGIEPPGYLQALNPALYEQECRRIQGRFDEAVELAEQAFLDELSKLVGHLGERLSGKVDGAPKVFRDSVLENFTEFFERFRKLNVRSSTELDQLVDQARQTLEGVEPQSLRDSAPLRSRIARQMTAVQATLDGLMVDRPRRSLVRPVREVTP